MAVSGSERLDGFVLFPAQKDAKSGQPHAVNERKGTDLRKLA